jgi:hypothetical protein
MADLVIRSLRGGLNNSDYPGSLPDDQVTVALNVEFFASMLGERRLGGAEADLTGSDLLNHDRVPFLFRFVPSTDEADAELWGLGVTGTSSSSLCHKTTSWSTIVPTDTITVSGTYQYQLDAAALHGKLFICYKSAEDRLHVWDGTDLRRTGLAEPAAPSVANTGAGSFTGTRYYRVRYIREFADYTIRSEPSETTTFAPSGTGSAARITKPATINEDETHWEIEASVDNSNFYVIATVVVGTTTYDDSTAFSPGYADDFELAPDIGDYTLIPSARFVVVDDDRLIWMSSFEDPALSSRVGWTPVGKADGDGNDERGEADTDPFIDLDALENGPITDGISGVQGYIYVFKSSHIYQLVRTGRRSVAYQAYVLTKDRGAIYGSACTGVDENGNPAVFFLDPAVGPCIIGESGVRMCGADVRATWETINLDAANVTARALYFPTKRQVRWWIATDDSDIPNKMLVLQTNEMRDTKDGKRRGWTLWDGPAAGALCACLFSDNIDDDTDRSNNLVPFIGLEGNGLIWRTETGHDDNGEDFEARIVTKPYTPVGTLHEFEIKSASAVFKAVEDAELNVSIIKDFGTQTKTTQNPISCTPVDEETQIIASLKDLGFSELHVAQIEFIDTDSPAASWQVNEFSIRHTGGQKA